MFAFVRVEGLVEGWAGRFRTSQFAVKDSMMASESGERGHLSRVLRCTERNGLFSRSRASSGAHSVTCKSHVLNIHA